MSDEPEQTAEQPEAPDQPDHQPEAPDQLEPPAPKRYTMRRAPRYYPFGITGLVVGVVIGLVIGSRPSDPVLDGQTYTAGSVLGYFVVAFGLVGVLLGLGLALLVERRRR